VTDGPAMAPELQVACWFNSEPLSLADLCGKVVVLGAFQMLCPGCVSTSLPQLQRIFDTFSHDALQVIGLHSVFEHHAAMTPVSLDAFLHEYRVSYPVAVDDHDDPAGIPNTMARYGFQGTPSLVLIDRAGRLRLHRFGHIPDLVVGAAIQQLLDEGLAGAPPPVKDEDGESCAVGGGCG
jgi:peroxiredoxin